MSFDFAEMGLSAYGQPLNKFEIAGTDGMYHTAKAEIMKDGTLEVFSEKVKDPEEVRYGWKNFLVGTLFNTFGLPASSFRSDNRE